MCDYRPGYFSESEKAFKSADLISCLKKFKAFEKADDLVFDQIGKFLYDRGFLLRLDSDDSWDREEGYYNLTYLKPVFPHNMVFTYEGTVKDPNALSAQLLSHLVKVYDEVIKNQTILESNKIYENIDFLTYLQDTALLQVCDILSMSSDQKKAFVFNMLQCIYYHEYFISYAQKAKTGIFQSYGIKKDTNRVTYKIGKFEFNLVDIMHGI